MPRQYCQNHPPKEKEQFKNFTLSVKDKKTFYEPDVPTVPLKLAGELRTEDNDKLHRILIVEDNDELRNYLFQSFSPIYNVQVCNNGKEALTIVKQFWPGLILSDIMMPEMRGDELCIAIKNDIETSHIPVVLLTALGDEKNILEGLHIGADEYIVKPFSINILESQHCQSACQPRIAAQEICEFGNQYRRRALHNYHLLQQSRLEIHVECKETYRGEHG